MTMTDPDMKALDAALAEAADHAPEVPDDLLAAVLRDAAFVQPRPVVRESLWQTVLDLIGGWPAVSGLAAAGVAGVWIGMAPPVALESAAAQILGTTQTVDLFGVDTLGGFTVEGSVE
jgi:hypothetical protein